MYTLDKLTYHSTSNLHHYYYSSRIDVIGRKLSQLISDTEAIHYFPEATIKSNHFPNGIAIHSKTHETTLIPTLLRDPGCGYLLFKVIGNQEIDVIQFKNALYQFCNLLESSQLNVANKAKSTEFLESILYSGATILTTDDLSKFTVANHAIEKDICLTKQDYTELSNELNNITNTIEIKKVIDVDHFNISKNRDFNPGDIIGFIHTGTDCFPNIIDRQFFKRMADYSYLNLKTNVDDIRSGLYGTHLADDLGHHYYQHVKAAMNYCIVKRWLIFNSFANFINQTLGLRIEMLNDRAHAGAFEIDNSHKKVIIQSRGVQEFHYSHDYQHHNYYLLAGQRETVSFLITPKVNLPNGAAIGHGTSYAVNEHFSYEQLLGTDNSKIYSNMCDQLSANTTLEKEQCLAYTFNIISQVQYLVDQNYCSTITCLAPLINYQGKSLVRRLAKDITHAS